MKYRKKWIINYLFELPFLTDMRLEIGQIILFPEKLREVEVILLYVMGIGKALQGHLLRINCPKLAYHEALVLNWLLI